MKSHSPIQASSREKTVQQAIQMAIQHNDQELQRAWNGVSYVPDFKGYEYFLTHSPTQASSEGKRK